MPLKLEAITKTYGDSASARTEVLRGIDLDIHDGASVAIVGPSGCGKSTLLNIMGTLDSPTSGRVLIDGADIGNKNVAALARIRNEKIGFVFQLHHLLPQCDVLENVLVPTIIHHDPGDAAARAEKLLERVGLSGRLTHRPGQLSVGECQRVAVVRALINRPRILLADEPTGSLDREGAGLLSRLLVELNREEGVTLVMVTHSDQLTGRMERVLELKDGKIAPS
jgi:lipoprotein-releasing system ATP-binding protein